MAGCGKAIKGCFLVVNVILLVFSLATVVVGVYILGDALPYQPIASNIVLASGAAMLMGGLAGMILALGGTVAAFGELKPFLVLYSLLGVVLALYSLAYGLYGATYPAHINISDDMRTALMYFHISSEFARTVDSMQLRFECCGIESAKNWTQTAFGVGGCLPHSCCGVKSNNNNNNNCNNNNNNNNNAGLCIQPGLVNSSVDNALPVQSRGCLSPLRDHLFALLHASAAVAFVGSALVAVCAAMSALLVVRIARATSRQQLEGIKLEAVRYEDVRYEDVRYEDVRYVDIGAEVSHPEAQ